MSGKLVVISGFSGAGKGTVMKKLLGRYEDYVLSVSMTTRRPRNGETDGVEYYFVTNEKFEELIREGGLLEHAGYADHYYGTPRALVEDNMKAGRDVLLEIEVQGAMQIRDKFPGTVMIFMAPPTAAELESRLTGRGTESEETVTKRLTQGLREVEKLPEYEYLLINDDADACTASLNRIIRGEEDGDRAVPEGGEIITDIDRKKQFAERFRKELGEIMAVRGIQV